MLVLVLAQGAAAFGFPLVRPAHAGRSACGCDHTGGPGSDCCCGTGACQVPTPPPEPEPPAKPKCPKCLAREAKAAEEGAVVWVAAWKARTCRGEGPLGLLAEIPAVPPAVPVRAGVALPPAGIVALADSHSTSLPAAPLDPPPRAG